LIFSLLIFFLCDVIDLSQFPIQQNIYTTIAHEVIATHPFALFSCIPVQSCLCSFVVYSIAVLFVATRISISRCSTGMAVCRC